MATLSKGANTALPEPVTRAARVRVEWAGAAGGPTPDLAVALVTVGADGRSAGADRVLSAARPRVLDGALTYDAAGPGAAGAAVALVDLPDDVAKVLVVASLRDADAGDLSALGALRVEVAEAADFDVVERGTERAMVLAELYRHQGNWKMRAVGQGYAEGPAGLAAVVGLSAGDLAPAAAAPAPQPPPAGAPLPPPTGAPVAFPPPPPPPPAAAPAAPTPPAPAAPTRVVLTKASPSVSLAKSDAAKGALRVNLNWTSREQQRSLLKRSNAIDLDLGCLYEFTDGSKGVVQALGGGFTAAPDGDPRPLIVLDGDDRSGAASAGENLTIDLDRGAAIRRVLLFAFIYEGTPNWAEARASVTWHPVGAPPVVVELDEHDPRSRMCAIAMLDNTAGAMEIRREVAYIEGGHAAMDAAYAWGLRWRAGRK